MNSQMVAPGTSGLGGGGGGKGGVGDSACWGERAGGRVGGLSRAGEGKLCSAALPFVPWTGAVCPQSTSVSPARFSARPSDSDLREGLSRPSSGTNAPDAR